LHTLLHYLAESVSVFLVNIYQNYKQERGCHMHFARLASKLLKDEESAQDNRVLACNFAKRLPTLKKKSLTESAINLS